MRFVWFCFGFIALALGTIGIFLPLLPTTPFLLLAAFCFARSSEKVHKWLLNHRIFGPIILDWRTHGAIKKRTKIIGVSSMILVFSLSIMMGLSLMVLFIQGITLSASAFFVLTRPSPPPSSK